MRRPRPRKPLVLFARDCGFCRQWVARWELRTGDRVRYAPMQSWWLRLWYGVPRREARRSVQLVEPSGLRSSGAEAVFRTLAHSPRMAPAMRVARLPGILQVAELGYRVIAAHRVAASHVHRLLFGTDPRPPRTRLVRWAFLRGLGGVYLVAFTSLRAQVLGLYGERGILPVNALLAQVRDEPLQARLRTFPTLLWLDDSDGALLRLTRAGQLASLALMANVAPRASAAALWALYVSFNSVGGDFLPFQWDALLMETGLHALLLAPGGLRPGLGRHEPAWTARMLMRWLAARLYLQSGLVKLQSGDPAWRSLSAVRYHYESQPLPTPLGWYFHHLPLRFQRFSTAVAVGLELGLPAFALGPRRIRHAGFAGYTGLQALIAATGNYGFFNLLASVLGLWLLDDTALARGRPAAEGRRPEPDQRAPLWRGAAQLAAAIPIAALSALRVSRKLRASDRLPEPLRKLDGAVAPLMSINPYGLFAVMTTRRPEISVEASMDGREWHEYEFRYKPGAATSRPRFVAPHLPRLDWLMWFAALSSRPPYWMSSLFLRLLQGSPDVMALFKRVPFNGRTPAYVRARRWDYHMTDLATRRSTGAWWRRDLLGLYFPAVSIRAPGHVAAPTELDTPRA